MSQASYDTIIIFVLLFPILTTEKSLRFLGLKLAEFIKHRSVEQLSTASLRAVIADLAFDHPDLVSPLQDLVSRKSFQSLIPSASSGGCAIQRDALIHEISRIYHPAILKSIEDVLNGFLESSGGVALQLSQSIFIHNQSSNTEASKSTVIASQVPHIASSPLISETMKSQCLSVNQRYFNAAVKIALLMGNANLVEASETSSSKGFISSTIRDSLSNILVKVPLSMLKNALK